MRRINSNPQKLDKKSSLVFNKENIQPQSIKLLHWSQKSLQTQKFPRQKVFLSPAEPRELIFAYLREHQGKYSVLHTYLEHQPDINAKMRGILIDWLVDVTNKFKLLPQTLFLTVNLIDWFLALHSVPRT